MGFSQQSGRTSRGFQREIRGERFGSSANLQASVDNRHRIAPTAYTFSLQPLPQRTDAAPHGRCKTRGGTDVGSPSGLWEKHRDSRISSDYGSTGCTIDRRTGIRGFHEISQYVACSCRFRSARRGSYAGERDVGSQTSSPASSPGLTHFTWNLENPATVPGFSLPRTIHRGA